MPTIHPRRRRHGVALLVTALALSVSLPATAAPKVPGPALHFALSSAEPGWIAFTIRGSDGAALDVTETVGGATSTLASLSLTAATVVRHHAAPWRCDRLRRTFVATETLPDADADTEVVTRTVTTPSCRAGFALSTWPQPARVGRPLDVMLTSTRDADHRPVRFCATRHATRVCHAATLSAQTGEASTRLDLHGPGQWRLSVTGPGIAVHQRLLAGRRPLRLLATGDSEIQVFDDQIRSALTGRAQVTGEAHISTGLSKLPSFNWLDRAQTQADDIHPDITVMSIGANDGFDVIGPHGTARCCGQDWVDGYAARAEAMMRSYIRRGAGRVYWMLLPTPARPDFVPVFKAIDAGFIKAAAHFPGQAHVVDIRPIFSPGGSYRRYVGAVDARESDGIHLSAAGDQIALRYLLDQMRSDGTL